MSSYTDLSHNLVTKVTADSDWFSTVTMCKSRHLLNLYVLMNLVTNYFFYNAETETRGELRSTYHTVNVQ